MQNLYSRRISSEEAREGFIFVLKNKLPFFPPIGRTFSLEQGGRWKNVKVESRACTCRGEDKPHEHFFIRWSGLKAGCAVMIKKTENAGRYLLNVNGDGAS